MRAALRFGASVLAVSGALLVADAAATLLWQEPLSALVAARGQAELERELGPAAAGPTRRPIGRGELARLARAQTTKMRRGRAVGRIELPTLRRSSVVVEGTDPDSLRRGPGHYPETPLPGSGRTAGVAGHRTTFGAPFRTVDRLRPGDPIEVEMPYGRLTYRVERTRIVSPRALWVVKPVGYDRLVLTACHPLYSAAQRIVVFARLVKATAPQRVAGTAAEPLPSS